MKPHYSKKNFNMKHFLICIALILFNSVNAQDTLTYQKCVEIALENNWGILIARDNQSIAANNAKAGNASLHPKVSLNAGLNGSLNNVTQQFVTESDKNSIKAARSTSENASIDVNYNLYQGKTRINNLKNFRIQSTMSELETKNTIEETMLLIGQAYYEVAGQQANLDLLDDVLKVSNERFKRTEYKYQYGDAVKIDVLNAEVNLNSDSIRYMTAQRSLAQAKKNLTVLMGQEPNEDFGVSLKVEFMNDLDRETLKNELTTNNTILQLSDAQITKAQYDLAIARGNRTPILGARVGYGINASQNDAGVLKSNLANGLNAGLTLTWDIYDGNKKNIKIQNASIQQHITEKKKEDQKLTLTRDLENSWSEYTYQLSVIRLQKRNIETNRLNFERSEEMYDFGQLTSTQYREAQVNYLQARYDFIVSNASAKVEELKLLRYSGRLVQ